MTEQQIVMANGLNFIRSVAHFNDADMADRLVTAIDGVLGGGWRAQALYHLLKSTGGSGYIRLLPTDVTDKATVVRSLRKIADLNLSQSIAIMRSITSGSSHVLELRSDIGMEVVIAALTVANINYSYI